MRKHFLLLLAILGMGALASANDSPFSKTVLFEKISPPGQLVNTFVATAYIPPCQSTKSWSESGSSQDCQGNTITVTVGSSCTVTRTTCFDADADAFFCAVITARNRLATMLMFDCG